MNRIMIDEDGCEATEAGEGQELTGQTILHPIFIAVQNSEILHVCGKDSWTPALSDS